MSTTFQVGDKVMLYTGEDAVVDEVIDHPRGQVCKVTGRGMSGHPIAAVALTLVERPSVAPGGEG